MRSLPLIFLLTIANASLLANAPVCFSNFASLAADDERAVEMVTSTYEALLELPPDPVVKQRLLDTLAKGEDPLVLSSEDSDLAMARKRLSEFNEMLSKLGWNTPGMKGLLLDLLNQRRDGVEQSRIKGEKELDQTQGERTFAFRANYDPIGVPGQPLLVGSMDYIRTRPKRGGVSAGGRPGGSMGFHLLDTETGRIDVVLHGKARRAKPIINRDGSKIIFANGPELLVFPNVPVRPGDTPFSIGGVQLTERFTKSGRDRAQITYVRALDNPNWMLVQHAGRRGLYLYDLEKKNYRYLKGSEVAGLGSPVGTVTSKWGVAAGTNTILMVTGEAGKRALRSADIGASGKLGTWTTIAEWPAQQPPEFSNNALLASHDFVLLQDVIGPGTDVVFERKTGRQIALHTLLPPDSPDELTQYQFQPNGKELLVTRTLKREMKVDVVDLATGAHQGDFKTLGYSVVYSSDGNTLFAVGFDGVRELKYRGRLNSP